MKKLLLLITLYSLLNVATADEVSIKQAQFTHRGASWKVDVTLRHADTGWQHYANEWRIVDEQGQVLGRRVLAHPHEHEQPFTRSLYDAVIPAADTVVYIEARDNVHGWSSDRLRVDLSRESGERYSVRR